MFVVALRKETHSLAATIDSPGWKRPATGLSMIKLLARRLPASAISRAVVSFSSNERVGEIQWSTSTVGTIRGPHNAHEWKSIESGRHTSGSLARRTYLSYSQRQAWRSNLSAVERRRTERRAKSSSSECGKFDGANYFCAPLVAEIRTHMAHGRGT